MKVRVFKNEVIVLTEEDQQTKEGLPSEEWDRISALPNPKDYLKVYEEFPGIKAAKVYLERPV